MVDKNDDLDLNFINAASDGGNSFFKESFIDPINEALPEIIPKIKAGWKMSDEEKKELQDFVVSDPDRNRLSYFMHMVRHAPDEHPFKEYVARPGLYDLVDKLRENPEFNNGDDLVQGISKFLEGNDKEHRAFADYSSSWEEVSHMISDLDPDNGVG